MNDKTKNLFLAAAVAGLMGASSGAIAKEKAAKKGAAKAEATGKCTQANECGGKGACKGGGNACKGQNSCKNHVIDATTEAQCKEAGGTFTK